MKKVHVIFCKYILSVPNKTTGDTVYAELGRMPLEIKIKTKVLFFWSKLVTGKQTKLSYIMYFFLLMLHNENIYSSEWITFIIDTLYGCGLSYLCLEQEYMKPEYVKRRVQLTLEDQYLQSWKQSLFDSNKCKLYRIIKKDFKLENYLLLLPYNKRKILTRCRTSNHKLPIENLDISVETFQKVNVLCASLTALEIKVIM